MTDAPNGWPDPSNPGVPLNPERDGWHWVRWPSGEPIAVEWRPGFQSPGWIGWRNSYQAHQFDYLGPCLTPAEVAAIRAEARDLARIEVAADMRSQAEGMGDAWTGTMNMLAARLLGGHAMQALEAIRAEARREGMREAAGIAAHDAITEPDENGCQWLIRHGDPKIAAAIRAAAETAALESPDGR